MGWQVYAVLGIVAVAGLYLAAAAWRTLAGKPGRCGGGCGCAGKATSEPKPTLVPVERLQLRRRDEREA